MNVTTTRYSIGVKSDGEVVIQRQDMQTGKYTVLPLTVVAGKIFAVAPKEEVDSSPNLTNAYDLLYEEGGLGTT